MPIMKSLYENDYGKHLLDTVDRIMLTEWKSATANMSEEAYREDCVKNTLFK